MSTPCLLIDSGNSRIKWAFAPGILPTNWSASQPRFLASGSIMHDNWSNLANDIGIQWLTLTANTIQPDISKHPTRECAIAETNSFRTEVKPSMCSVPHGIWLSNVAGKLAEQTVRMALRTLWGRAAHDHLQVIHSSAEAACVINHYTPPSCLGTDRWASLIGAHAAYRGEHLLIVTLGTTTTLDYLSATGEFLGGVIAPGPAMMLSSLAQGTAQLPYINIENKKIEPWLRFAKNTHDALIAGCLGAQAGLIERSHAALQRDLGGPVRCILSGGARSMITQLLSIKFTEHDSLVLAGLYQLASKRFDSENILSKSITAVR
ncbi:type III pantothenate kinase [Candidatus Pandoraea novymonadis]|uniref:Type III pantothenate kinase n=1 Tax=Candidatus Pandoraea novymonadis TaxID=1808959 RepID=A0ABX5FD90_9BURK|nr:type III pantothenate kinase [Candidatus Pandoraea novymonadis]PSB91730.1 Type III pantothenate kinase [Candidatus Pandoraea novymonadis]